jgi:hypothetical protein
MTRQKARLTSKKEFIPLDTMLPPSTLEGRPVSMIAADCLSKEAYAMKLPRAITEESLIQSFQNGLSKGFINGLKTALLFVEQHKGTGYTIPELASSLGRFIEESENEQI